MGIFSTDEHYCPYGYCAYEQHKQEIERKKIIAETYITKESLEKKLRVVLDIINDQIGCSDVGYFIKESEARNALEQADCAFSEIQELLEELL